MVEKERKGSDLPRTTYNWPLQGGGSKREGAPVRMELQDRLESPCPALAMHLQAHPFPRRGPSLQPVFFSLTPIYVPDNSTHHRANCSTRAPSHQPDIQPPTTHLKAILGQSLLGPRLAGHPARGLSLTVSHEGIMALRRTAAHEVPTRSLGRLCSRSAWLSPVAAFPACLPSGTVVRAEASPHPHLQPQAVMSDGDLFLLGVP